MFNVTADRSYLALAANISSAAMRALADKQGVFSEVCDGGKTDAPPCVLNDDARIFKGIFVRYLGHLVPVLHQIASTSVTSNSKGSSVSAHEIFFSASQARTLLSNISSFINSNFAYALADPRNTATWLACDAIPMPRPSAGAVWQSSRETVFAGYTSTLSVLDLAIVHALLRDAGYDQ